jgi:hypothetical protein
MYSKGLYLNLCRCYFLTYKPRKVAPSSITETTRPGDGHTGGSLKSILSGYGLERYHSTVFRQELKLLQFLGMNLKNSYR